MDLVGQVTLLGVTYPLVYTSFNRTSRMWLLLKPERKSVEYLQGRRVELDDIVEMLDIGQQIVIGAAVILQRVLKELADFRVKCVLEIEPSLINGVSNYTDINGNRLNLVGQHYEYISYRTKAGLVISMERAFTLNIAKKDVRGAAEKHVLDRSKISVSTFLDSTMESLELRGYDFEWLKQKTYVAIHTWNDVLNVLLVDFKIKLKEALALGKKLVVTLDFESTGLEAYGDLHPSPDKATFVGMSFEDHKAYGIFLDMEHFENVPSDKIAELFTHLFSHDLRVDRNVTILDETFKRSAILTTGHNVMIDRRFGLTIGMDVWFNVCSMQIGSNLDPFLTKGHNGAKDRAKQFFGIDYPELGETAGKDFYGYFNRFSDKRVILMYGCADVDLPRMFTIKMLEEIPKLEQYFGADQIVQWFELDEVYLNMKAFNDFKGIRTNRELVVRRSKQVASKIDTYHKFLASYVPRASMAITYINTMRFAEESGRDIRAFTPPRFDTVKPMVVDKWSGDFLISVLFKMLGYVPLAVSNNGSGKPKLDKKAIKDYLQHTVEVVYPETITSLEEYSIKAKYLAEDILFEDKSVAISAAVFNSYQYPLFYVLSLLGPLEKEMSADLAPLMKHDCDYRFVDTRSTTIVTRRDVSPLSTVKGANKDLYIPYTEDYYILDADQAAVELRIAFGLSENDEMIMPLFNEEADPHIETASQMLRKPAYLIDRLKERGPIKFINFGRIYMRGARSICEQIFNRVSAELLARTEALLALFDREKKPVHDVLNKYRARAILPTTVPEWLKWFLKMDDTTVYGKMDNTFGFAQHVNLSREESWYVPAMQRKAGNFAVQGVAANILRVLYNRFVLACWDKGWIQDGRVIIHNTIYDEILMSYHKSINPYELLTVLRESFVVRYRKFPPLYLGVNIARSWGDTKSDKYEIPHKLLATYAKNFRKGEYREDYSSVNHVDMFLDNIVQYKKERIKEELKNTGFVKTHILNMEDFSKKFDSYYVRALLMEFKPFMFKITDVTDPVEVLAATLFPFISREVLDEGEVLKIRMRGKSIGITNKTHTLSFDSEYNFLRGIKTDVKVVEAPVESNETDIDEDEEVFYSFNDDEEDNYIFGEMSLTSWVVPEEYDPSKLRLDATIVLPCYKNFTVRAKNVVIKCSDAEHLNRLKAFLRGKSTTSMDSITIYSVYRAQTRVVGQYKESTLAELDGREDLWRKRKSI